MFRDKRLVLRADLNDAAEEKCQRERERENRINCSIVMMPLGGRRHVDLRQADEKQRSPVSTDERSWRDGRHSWMIVCLFVFIRETGNDC